MTVYREVGRLTVAQMNYGSLIKAECKIEEEIPNLSDRECNIKVPLTS